jgi:hypothetical protein
LPTAPSPTATHLIAWYSAIGLLWVVECLLWPLAGYLSAGHSFSCPRFMLAFRSSREQPTKRSWRRKSGALFFRLIGVYTLRIPKDNFRRHRKETEKGFLPISRIGKCGRGKRSPCPAAHAVSHWATGNLSQEGRKATDVLFELCIRKETLPLHSCYFLLSIPPLLLLCWCCFLLPCWLLS